MAKSSESPKSYGLFHPFYNWMKGIFRFIGVIGKNFFRDNCYDKASALAFYSALSIVPVLAVMFGIAQGFGFGKDLEANISDQFFQQAEVKDKLIQFAHSWLQNVEGGVIAGVGTLILLWSVISLLISVESSLNEIWKINTGRRFLQKIRDYLTVIFIAPLIFVASSSINFYLVSQVTATARSNVFVEQLSPYLLFFLSLFPLFLIWILFTFVYIFVPNTRVYFREAAIAGVIAGTAFQLWQWLYIKFQLNVTTYGAVYGSFAAVPLFLIWLQVSWIIVLAGAEIAVEMENGFFMRNRKPQILPVKTAALWVVYSCADAFAKAEPPMTDLDLKNQLGIPLNHLHRILEVLCKNRIISEVSLGGETLGYQPAQAIQNITPQLVGDAIDKLDEIPAHVTENAELEKIEQLVSEMNKPSSHSFGNKSLYSILSSKA